MLFILRYLKFLANEVIADIFMAEEAILLRWLSLIPLTVYSNVGPGSNFATSMMLFILSRSKLSSKDVVILEISNCDIILTDISLITSVASERHDVFELRVISSSSICFDFFCDIVLWNPPIILLVVWKFDLMERSWPVICSQIDPKKMDVQRWK